tara:strand:- start:257 stop:646 length:390 start_codon:yes stop_codon:yes gene_type:complete
MFFLCDSACAHAKISYNIPMTQEDIMTRPTDTYYVVTAATYPDPTRRWIVGGTASEQLALSIGERQVAAMVSGFASREEAIETYPELADATEGQEPWSASEARWEPAKRLPVGWRNHVGDRGELEEWAE